MTLLLLLLALAVAASSVFSGSETGFYSLSPVRVDLEARQGLRLPRLVARLLKDESALLITILIGNNLTIELATHLGDSIAEHLAVPVTGREILVTLCLTPILFLFGEVLPKDVFRRRPHSLIRLTAAPIALARVVFWPLERLLSIVARALEWALGLDARVATRLRGREAVMHFLAEGRRSGALSERAEALAGNALQLRSIPIARVMVPWTKVVHLARGLPEEELLERVRTANYSRLPVVGEDGACEGFVHQLDVLSAAPGVPVLGSVRPIPCLPADMPVDRALHTLRGSGKRVALVGEPGAPLGLLTLKDLLEEISGELAGF